MTDAVQAAVLVGKLPRPRNGHRRNISGPRFRRERAVGSDIDIRRVSQQGRRIHYCHSSTVHSHGQRDAVRGAVPWLSQPPSQGLERASRSASRAKDLSSPRKLPLYDPNAKILPMTTEMIPFVQNSWVKRVPSAWSSNVACWTPRRSQLPKRVLTSVGRSTWRTSLGLRIRPNHAV